MYFKKFVRFLGEKELVWFFCYVIGSFFVVVYFIKVIFYLYIGSLFYVFVYVCFVVVDLLFGGYDGFIDFKI